MTDEDERPSDYYSPQRIRWWLRNWLLLVALAESPATSGHHLGHEEDDARPCMPSPSGGPHMKAQRRDQHYYSDIVADLERAHASLRYLSLEWNLVDTVMRHGPMGMRELRGRVHRDQNAVTDAYRSAVERMAKYLSE